MIPNKLTSKKVFFSETSIVVGQLVPYLILKISRLIIDQFSIFLFELSNLSPTLSLVNLLWFLSGVTEELVFFSETSVTIGQFWSLVLRFLCYRVNRIWICLFI